MTILSTRGNPCEVTHQCLHFSLHLIIETHCITDQIKRLSPSMAHPHFSGKTAETKKQDLSPFLPLLDWLPVKYIIVV